MRSSMNIHAVANLRVGHYSRSNGHSVFLEFQSEDDGQFDLTIFSNEALLTRLVEVFGDERTRDYSEPSDGAQS